MRLLPTGTCLFDPETGDEIGVFYRDGSVPVRRAEDGSSYLAEIDTRWGSIEVSVEPGDEFIGHDWPDEWQQCQP